MANGYNWRDPHDFTNLYNTPIPADKQAAFSQWIAKRGTKDYYDYDIQGAWLAGAGQDPRGHFTDQFKKPNHPTFSTESQYSTPQNPGGQWLQSGDAKWAFMASPANLIHRTPEELQTYFKQVEPDSPLYLPPTAPPPATPPLPAGLQAPQVQQ